MIDASFVVTPRQRNTPKEIQSRVEHVFGFIERSMGGFVFRGVGMLRARACVALTYLTYNIAQLRRFSSITPIGQRHSAEEAIFPNTLNINNPPSLPQKTAEKYELFCWK